MYRAGLTDLDAVMVIARKESFRAAAIDLGMSTTALSHAIAKLEASLGIRLFNRTTRSVSLTDAGRQFVKRVGPALLDIHDAMAAARSQRETPSGTLRINAAPVAARAIIAPLVLEFLRRYPEMHVDLVTEGRLVDIVAEGFDLGVRVAGLVPNDMISLSLGRPQRYSVVGAPAYFDQHPRPLAPSDLADHPCIRVRLPNGAMYRWQFEKNGEAVQVDVRGPITLDESSLARAAALESTGLGFFMEQDVLADLDAGRLIRVLDDWTPPFPGLCLYYPGRRNPSAGLKAFLALAREVATGPKRSR
ncbi:LysR family transcriptional regulator [Bosea caraganae]|uniref:LysR family transcriptional regulator n=1 Tax=Bosea caraganae TaxID=2763117 RepID=A0A370L9G0_9HYPH|nr:LysR family transcriptional regulator [Bosea caraganae]RDJ22034.1 LysR family transcriptional regulator [Bosea caraganae]RDJ27933.1 LysR family transcriptional regulator [Bosea caraganae]